MTVAVGFLCQDGAVIGADSMLTPSVGGLNVGHHKGKKVHVLSGQQVYAFAGDQGQAARFQIMAEASHAAIGGYPLAIDYPLNLSAGLFQQFTQTGIAQSIGVNTLLAYPYNDTCQICAFEGPLQPRLLDPAHFYVALGSGKLSADPFLRFLVDIFCLNGPPTLSEAVFLTVWSIEHVIKVNPGGVSEPTKVAVLERESDGAWRARELSDDEIDDHRQAMASAVDQLREWREKLGGPQEPEEAPPAPPEPPANS